MTTLYALWLLASLAALHPASVAKLARLLHRLRCSRGASTVDAVLVLTLVGLVVGWFAVSLR